MELRKIPRKIFDSKGLKIKIFENKRLSGDFCLAGLSKSVPKWDFGGFGGRLERRAQLNPSPNRTSLSPVAGWKSVMAVTDGL
jgi:hypothetical protein